MSVPVSVPARRAARPRRGDLQYTPPPRPDRRRPAQLDGRQPTGPGVGVPCPDAGYARTIATHLRDRVVLGPGEDLDDALWAASVLAMARAGKAGRAPSGSDVKAGLQLLGLLVPVEPSLGNWRRDRIFHVASDRDRRRQLVNELVEHLDDNRPYCPPQPPAPLRRADAHRTVNEQRDSTPVMTSSGASHGS